MNAKVATNPFKPFVKLPAYATLIDSLLDHSQKTIMAFYKGPQFVVVKSRKMSLMSSFGCISLIPEVVYNKALRLFRRSSSDLRFAGVGSSTTLNTRASWWFLSSIKSLFIG